VPHLTLHLNADHPEPRKIGLAAEALERGEVALYPTDTVYALGCAIETKKAVSRVYRLKQMDERQPLAIICPDLREIARYAVVSDFAYRQLRRWLPGPYTFVLEASREVPKILLHKQRTIGVRWPKNPICEALARSLGRPIITSSAIPPGADAACIDVEDAKAAWPQGIDLFLDGGMTSGKLSTVVSLVGDEIQLLRAGLGAEEIA
jgi:tRNA threonylcarbamoyl adenosine modification protein (Sua5/YciO/YrdC/YwlC family)